MNFFQQAPFSRLLLFLILGIVIQSQINISFCTISFILSISIVFLVLSHLPKINKRHNYCLLFGVGLFLLVFGSGVFLTQLSWEKSKWDIKSVEYLYKGQVIDEPIMKPKTRMCKIRIISAEKSVHQKVINKQAVIYLPIDSLSLSIISGNYLLFLGKLEESSPYLKKQSFASSGFIRQTDWILEQTTDKNLSISLKALSIRRTLLSRLRQIITENQSYAIAAALMFGSRTELDKDLQQSVANIGASHILAISGAHFAILFGMVYFLLSFIGNSQKGKLIKQLIVFPLIWIFAFVTGFSPSVVRAAFMLCIWGIGNAFSYKPFTLNTVIATAFLMLVFNPLYFYDVGFQLSFASVISIILINPYLVKLYKSKNLFIKYLWDLSCVSIAAQIGVLPLSIYYFHQFPIIFLLTNWLLIPLSAILLFLIPVSMFCHSLFAKCFWLWFPLNKMLDSFIFITQALNRLPRTNINNLNINLWEITVLFLATILITLSLLQRRAVYLCLLLILIVLQIIYYL